MKKALARALKSSKSSTAAPLRAFWLAALLLGMANALPSITWHYRGWCGQTSTSLGPSSLPSRTKQKQTRPLTQSPWIPQRSSWQLQITSPAVDELQTSLNPSQHQPAAATWGCQLQGNAWKTCTETTTTKVILGQLDHCHHWSTESQLESRSMASGSQQSSSSQLTLNVHITSASQKEQCTEANVVTYRTQKNNTLMRWTVPLKENVMD